MKVAPIFLIILILPIATASIEITKEPVDGFLGDALVMSARVTASESKAALAKFTINCGETETLYSVAPVELKSGEVTIVEASALKAFLPETCSITLKVEGLDGSAIENTASKEFIITDILDFSVSAERKEFLPGEVIRVKGELSKKGRFADDSTIKINFDEESRVIYPTTHQFEYNLKARSNIKTGTHTINLVASDEYGNQNSADIEINIKAVPSAFLIFLGANEYKPNDNLAITSEIHDQADDLMAGKSYSKLYKKGSLLAKEIILFEASYEGKYDYKLSNKIAPDDYLLRSTYANLSDERTVKIIPYADITITQSGSIIAIKNTGNVRYKNETSIMLAKDGKNYIINKKLNLGIDDEMKIDLEKEVPAGIYGLSVDGKAGNVEIKQGKKTGIAAVTGFAVAGAGLIYRSPKLGLSLIVLALMGLICFYNRETIKRIINKFKN
ncbi:MAG TPA: hypothetical protein VFF28_04675 [Candidatus Nanoarchaeia archaeon]|nr:hypothetical protein [Candidatus Nanoarchaeia archaeon]